MNGLMDTTAGHGITTLFCGIFCKKHDGHGYHITLFLETTNQASCIMYKLTGLYKEVTNILHNYINLQSH